MSGKTCEDCSHFRQHYVMDNQSCTMVCCGHCVYPRIKSRRPDAPACRHFEEGERKLPVSRHFLTMEVLRWVQSLEIPPEIRERE